MSDKVFKGWFDNAQSGRKADDAILEVVKELAVKGSFTVRGKGGVTDKVETRKSVDKFLDDNFRANLGDDTFATMTKARINGVASSVYARYRALKSIVWSCVRAIPEVGIMREESADDTTPPVPLTAEQKAAKGREEIGKSVEMLSRIYGAELTIECLKAAIVALEKATATLKAA